MHLESQPVYEQEILIALRELEQISHVVFSYGNGTFLVLLFVHNNNLKAILIHHLTFTRLVDMRH